MGSSEKHKDVKLIIGLIGKEALFDEVQKSLVQEFGAIDFASDHIEFTYTNYYEKEMGKGLKRKFLTFKQEINPSQLVDIKLFSNELESKFLESSSSRQVNIDPGYITLSKLILATTKDHQHRIYLDKGIFAEVTLRFRGKTFRGWEWSYIDYCSPEYIKIFNHIRNNLMKINQNANNKNQNDREK